MKKAHRFLLMLVPVTAVPVYLVLFQAEPGDLSRVHTGLPGQRSCAQCHAPEGLRAGCLKCHEEIAVQRKEKRGYHVALEEQGKSDCGACHSDHRGREFRPLNVTSWPDQGPSAFTHAHLDAFALAEGKHAEIATKCEACHAREFVDALPSAHADLIRSSETYLGLDATCRRCHETPHREVVGEACERCHDQSQWKEATGFDHEPVFSLEGEHTRVACDKCHQPHATDPVGAVAGTSCAACHTDPHGARPLQVSFTAAARACSVCHGEEARGFAGDVLPYERAEHATGRFPLAGKHREAACRACHRRAEDPPTLVAAVRPASLDSITQSECAACHVDAHGEAGSGSAQFSTGGACTSCHDEQTWRPAQFSGADHAAAGFALAGVHGQAKCVACHAGGASPAPRSQGSSVRDCAACHETPHRASISTRCADCHGTEETAWRGATLTVEQHALTGFPLTAPHAGRDCAACHDAAKPYPERHVDVAAADCRSCHEDVHRGQFAATSCAVCHTKTWRPSTFNAARHVDVGFPLEGGHLATACDACHQATSKPKAARTASQTFRGTAASCRACHETPHGSQFDALIRDRDCRVCHSTRDWDVQKFDHEGTRFPLAGAHETVNCDACHPKTGGRPGARLRPLRRDCAGCHGDPHVGQFKAESCQTCHDKQATTWALEDFDHQGTRFPLDGAHDSLACARCHQPHRLKDGREVVRYRPLGVTCKDCHGSFEND